MTVFHGQCNDSGSTVAKGQTLHDTQDTDAVESPDGCPELFAEAETFMGACPVVTESGEPADGKSDQEDDNSTLQYLQGGCMTELEVVLLQGDIGRDTHDEHEEGEDEVGGGEAIPLSVAQGGIYMSPSAGVVHHNHARNGDTAKDVEGKNALVCLSLTVHCNKCVKLLVISYQLLQLSRSSCIGLRDRR